MRRKGKGGKERKRRKISDEKKMRKIGGEKTLRDKEEWHKESEKRQTEEVQWLSFTHHGTVNYDFLIWFTVT